MILAYEMFTLTGDFAPHHLYRDENFALFHQLWKCEMWKWPEIRIREGWHLQNWWIFGKVPNGLWPTPPSFSENHVALFATKLRQKCVCSVWRDCCVLYDPISHEMHVVQQFNMVLPLNWLKTYPKKALLYHFHAEKALFKVQNLQHKFLDWKWPPPPPQGANLGL